MKSSFRASFALFFLVCTFATSSHAVVTVGLLENGVPNNQRPGPATTPDYTLTFNSGLYTYGNNHYAYSGSASGGAFTVSSYLDVTSSNGGDTQYSRFDYDELFTVTGAGTVTLTFQPVVIYHGALDQPPAVPGQNTTNANWSVAAALQVWNVHTATNFDSNLTFAANSTSGVVDSISAEESILTVNFTPNGGSQTGRIVIDLSADAYVYAFNLVTGEASSNISLGLQLIEVNGTDAVVTFASGHDYTTVSAVPEPTSFAAFAGLLGLAFAGSRRR